MERSDMEIFVQSVEKVFVADMAEFGQNYAGTCAVRSLANRVIDRVAQTEGAKNARDPNAVLGFAVGVADAVFDKLCNRTGENPLNHEGEWDSAIEDCVNARIAATKQYQADK